jgi:hypothetical protein
MKKFLTPLISFCLLLSTLTGQAQSEVSDTSIMIPMLYVSYSYQWPGGDLKDRFGSNSNIGGGFQLKLKSNWIFGADFNYLFSNKVNGSDSLFRAIDTDDGYLIDQNGELTAPLVYERGYYTSVRFGKLFPVLSPNPNSGPFIMGSVGLLQHKIRIENPGNAAPQIVGDYVKGYDQLTNGIGISEFIGYMYMGNQRLISFFGGVEFTQAFTQSRRSYDFNLGARDAKKRTDLLWGFKVGWIIPFYKRVPKGYYYN